MSHVHQHNPHDANRLQHLMMVGIALTMAVALVILGIHLAPGPRLQPAQPGTQANTQVKPSTSSSASGAPTTNAPSTAQAASVTAQSASSSSTAAQVQPVPVPEPTPTAASHPTPAVVNGAAPQAVAAIQQFDARNAAVLATSTAIGGPFTASATGIVGQYYAGAVVEYHPELAQTPYDVELARIGVASAEASGLLDTTAFKSLPATTKSDANCIFVKATGHRLCNGFRAYWQSHGLDFGDAGTSYRESLALFGYPISEEFVDPNTGLVVQYFERTVLEYDPSKPQRERVRANDSTDMVRTRLGTQIVLGIQHTIAGK